MSLQETKGPLLFRHELLERNPSLAQVRLKDYWRDEADLTRHTLQEFGVPATCVWTVFDMIQNPLSDAANGTGTFEDVAYDADEAIERYIKESDLIKHSVLPAKTTEALIWAFVEAKTNELIFAYCNESEVKALCKQVTGGIPRLE